MVIILIISFLLIGFVGILIGRMSKSVKVVTLHDILKSKETYRSETQKLQDGVMQLKNEIANSNAMKIEELESGDYNITLKVVI